MVRATKVGQLAAWKQFSRIAQHCKIEIALDLILRKLDGNERWSIN
jgi:hypothetical protein